MPGHPLKAVPNQASCDSVCSYENLDGSCDYCGEYIADKDCLCVCHAKTIGAFMYKIFKIIDKLFNTNLVGKVFDISDICACGIAHY